MKFRITEQKVVIAPKANNDIGNPKSYIREAESFEDLLLYKETDDTEIGWIYCGDSYTDNLRFKNIVKEIEDNDRNFFTNEDGEYWGTDPRSEDGYALDGIEITIKELTEEEIIKEEARRKKALETIQKAKEDRIQKSNNDWFNLLKSLNLEETNQRTLLDKLQEYQFPSKIK